MEIEFLADMGISLRTVSWLREQGYDVVHLRDEGLQTLSDQEILAKAKREKRIILTVDLDFSQLLAISGYNLPSVILFRLGNENYNLSNQRLTIVLRDYTKALKTGAIVSVTDRIFRIRFLPI
ncbi:MAG: hypothetical protein GPJ21_07450 [Microcystis aeruginosa W13-11]|nr:hypothetical protein [Microcystis aeruginosa W13-11]